MPHHSEQFSDRIIAWYHHHGRKDLPWQQHPTPYRVWISEIMLQQTQVTTVIPYYERFMQRFPGLVQLAEAELDEVLHHWSGLGYYARARHLHRAAKLVVNEQQGQLPTELEPLMALPGIGRSTAGAILSLALEQPQPILDGNVKRVLTRCFAVPGWPGSASVQKQLWALSESLTPSQQTSTYNQAMMDLGATLCRRSEPGCPSCPLVALCQAHQQGNPTAYPAAKPHKKRPTRTVVMLLLHDGQGQVLLEARPEHGVWGGLWSLPEFSDRPSAESTVASWLGNQPREIAWWPERQHTFSHFHLLITPLAVRITRHPECVMDGDGRVWYNTDKPGHHGVAAPVSRLLKELKHFLEERSDESYGGLR